MLPELEIDGSIERAVHHGMHVPRGLKPLEAIAPVRGWGVGF